MRPCTRLTFQELFVKTRSVPARKWLLLAIALTAVAVRLILINQPFVDNWSWRQSDVATIARHFARDGFRFSRPQIDWAGNAAGYVGTEFPILPFAAALSYKAFGNHEWIGRMQAVMFFAFALPFFYLLVRDVFGAVAAVWATFFYSFAPLSIVASRAFMPDIPSLSLALAGMYFFLRWIETDEITSLAGSALLISASLLIKLPTIVIGAPLAYLALGRMGIPPAGSRISRGPFSGAAQDARRGEQAAHHTQYLLFAIVALAPAIVWYWHAHQVAQEFYPHHFFGGGGVRIMSAAWYWTIAKQTAGSSLTPVLCALAVAGALLTPQREHRFVFHWWLAAMAVFIFVVGWGNRHQWYQLPLVPIAAAFAGCACVWIASKLHNHKITAALSIVVIASFGALAFAYARPFYLPVAAALRNLGLELKAMTPADALIVAADNGDPTVFYYAERKGWHFTEDGGIYNGEPSDNAEAIVDLESLRKRGADYMVFTSGTRWWLDYYREFAEHLAKAATLVKSTPQFVIYRLNPSVP